MTHGCWSSTTWRDPVVLLPVFKGYSTQWLPHGGFKPIVKRAVAPRVWIQTTHVHVWQIFIYTPHETYITKGRGFFAPGCKCSLYFKCNLNIFWIVKKNLKKCCMYIFTTNAWAKLFHENPTLPMGEAKKTKFGGKIRVCTRHFLFYSQHYKYWFTSKLGHTYVVCRDVHAKFLFGIFSHFQICFLNKESICTLDQICISP
jgi:hypothetical protein